MIESKYVIVKIQYEREYGSRCDGHMSKQIQTSMGKLTINALSTMTEPLTSRLFARWELLADSLAGRIIGLYVDRRGDRQLLGTPL